MIPAKSRRFLVHWRGRSATNAATAGGRRPGSSTIVAGAASAMPRLYCASSDASGRPASLRRPRGQHQAEAAALAGLRVELDAAAEGSRELPRDRQPEPGSLGVVRDERAEDPLGVLARDPRAGVGDVDAHGPV